MMMMIPEPWEKHREWISPETLRLCLRNGPGIDWRSSLLGIQIDGADRKPGPRYVTMMIGFIRTEVRSAIESPSPCHKGQFCRRLTTGGAQRDDRAGEANASTSYRLSVNSGLFAVNYCG